MSFDNSSIKNTPNKDKPHLVFIGGYWRVSKPPASAMWPRNLKQRRAWSKAHQWAAQQNRKGLV